MPTIDPVAINSCQHARTRHADHRSCTQQMLACAHTPCRPSLMQPIVASMRARAMQTIADAPLCARNLRCVHHLSRSRHMRTRAPCRPSFMQSARSLAPPNLPLLQLPTCALAPCRPSLTQSAHIRARSLVAASIIARAAGMHTPRRPPLMQSAHTLASPHRPLCPLLTCAHAPYRSRSRS